MASSAATSSRAPPATRTKNSAFTALSPAFAWIVPPSMLTKPRVASLSLFDLMASPPAATVMSPSAIFTQSLPRSPSATASTVMVPPAMTRSSLDTMPFSWAPLTASDPFPLMVRSSLLKSAP